MKRLDRVDDAHLGRLRLDSRLHRLEVGLGHDRNPQRIRAQSLGAQLDLRCRLLPETYRTLRPAPARLPSAPPVMVDLPIPGEPPMSTIEPGTRPPPSTRSSSPIPVCRRRSLGASTSASGTGGSARFDDERLEPDGGDDGGRSSTIVFHSP